MFSEVEAARLLRVPQSTLHWWLDGGVYRGKQYKPVIRVEPTGQRFVTWAEFVESGLLRTYRRTHGVSLSELRVVMDRLCSEYGMPYPRTHHRPFVGPGRRLLLRVQEESKLEPELCLVAVASGQVLLTAPAEEFYERVEWDDDIAVSWRPHDDPASRVRMSPAIRFGRPAVGGVSTEVLWEQLDGGASVEEVAGSFDLSVQDVRWAYSYESSVRAAA